jgi:ribosomal protein S18 acetylase RimI-like enzyme
MTTPRSKISLRPALASDLPEIASLDIAAHPHHPITRLAWSDPSDAYPIFLSRYQLLFSLPYYHFLVATQPTSSSLSSSPSSSEEEQEEIVGLVIWKEGGKHEEPEFKPEFPPTANMGLIQYFLGQNIAHQKSLPIEGMAELEVLAVRPGQQRKGIEGLLLGSVLKEVGHSHLGSLV